MRFWKDKEFWLSVAQGFFLFFGLVAAIIALTWPAARWWARGFPRHWDPPLHAWKLCWNAEGILKGHWLPEGHANAFYPHAYTLYFDDLFWLPSLFAAVVRLFTSNPAIIYHLTMWALWALSGVGAYRVFRALGCGRLASAWGATAFCCLPYRASYYVEFNMQLCFGIPWFFYFAIRYFRTGRPAHILGAALTFVAQAITALYYAVMLSVAFPFFLLPYLDPVRTLLRSKRFWTSVVLSGAIAAFLGGLFLWPYGVLSGREHLKRSLTEVKTHSAEPLNWIWRSRVRASFLGFRPPQSTEMVVFPGDVVSVLAFMGVLVARRIREPEERSETEGPRRITTEQLVVLFVLLWLFADLWASRLDDPPAAWLSVRPWLGLTLILIAAAGAVWEGRENASARPVLGLVACSMLCWILSFGPQICLTEWCSENPVFQWMYDHIFWIRSVRVVSRFSLIPLLTWVAFGVLALDFLFRHSRAFRWLWPAYIALSILDGRGGIGIRYSDWQPASLARSFLDIAERSGEPRTLMVQPMGDRFLDSRYMLAFQSRHVWLFNGWSGFMPTFTRSLALAFGEGRIDDALWVLGGVHPPAYLAVDLSVAQHWRFQSILEW
ncbi:MAG: hypothetical protein QXN56_06950, partial [Candidatus Hadarchaeum sp.]